MNKKINIGIIGLGIGEQHLKSYLKIKNCEVITICDLDEKKINTFKKKYSHIKITNDENLIFNDKNIHLVSIASYDNFHYSQIIKSIKNRKHIFVEKPLCMSFSELKKIDDALNKKNNIKISSNMVLRTVPLFEKIKLDKKNYSKESIHYIEADYLWGRINKIFEWRSKLKNYSLILGASIHMIDLIIWILNCRPVYVQTSANKIFPKDKKIKFDTFIVIILYFENGLIAKIASNSICKHPHFHSLKIFSQSIDFIHDLKNTYTIDKKQNIKLINIKKLYPAKNKRSQTIHDFVDYIRTGKKKSKLVTKKEIFDLMSICFSSIESLKTAKKTFIKYI